MVPRAWQIKNYRPNTRNPHSITQDIQPLHIDLIKKPGTFQVPGFIFSLNLKKSPLQPAQFSFEKEIGNLSIMATE